MKNYKILNLYAENIKKVKVIDITPESNVIEVTGKNKQGKTSTLDAIAYALGGKALICKNPVSSGEQTAIIKVDVGEFVITRKWTNPETSYLKIEFKNGMSPGNPQKFLNDIIGNLAFDPMAFVDYDKQKRIDILKKITGLNFDKLNKDYEELYQRRRDESRDLKQLEGELNNYKDLPGMAKVRPIEVVQKEYQEAVEHNEKTTKAEKEIKLITQSNIEIIKQIKQFQEIVAENKIELIKLKPIAAKKLKDNEKIGNELKEVRKCADLQYKIKRKKELVKKAENYKTILAEIEKDMAHTNKTKKEMIENADMPVKGLAFGADDVTFEDVEFSEISQAQQIEVSMSIAMAENPKMKIIRIMNGSLLDDESLEKIKQIAKEKDHQVWIEKVSNKKEKGKDIVFIEAGEIK